MLTVGGFIMKSICSKTWGLFTLEVIDKLAVVKKLIKLHVNRVKAHLVMHPAGGAAAAATLLPDCCCETINKLH